jgi:hypothetical protein
MNINELSIFTPNGFKIDPDTTPEAWKEHHRKIMFCRAFSRQILRESRMFATEKWGVDFVAESEIQMELALGLPEPKPEKPTLNPKDKSRVITIEGINQSFTFWNRRMAPEIEKWDKERLSKALALLEPIEAQTKRIRELLEATH